MHALFESLVSLITETSTNLPPDVRAAMKRAQQAEIDGSRASQSLAIIAENIDTACEVQGAICQDTGMPTFEVHVPIGVNQIAIRKTIREAVAEATRRGKLRPNSVDSLTGENSGDNLGPGTPIIHFDQWERDEIEVRLILKGGGCENTNAQYSLPSDFLHLGRADRTIDGVRKAILHAVWNAQGKGCGPGALGVCIGGDRTSGYAHAKQQLFRTLDDVNPDPRLRALEEQVMATVNSLGVGPMGFGGGTTLIGCKVGVQNRLPASFFVSIAYDCWAFRRLGVLLDAQSGAIRSWQFRDPAHTAIPMVDAAAGTHAFALTGSETVLRAPIDEATIRALKVGDVVLVSGRAYTGRDAVHHHLMSHEPPVDLRGSVLYHCGPVVKKEDDGGWRITAAGPTTSIREEPFQAEVIGRYGVRAVIGKGGMGAKTLAALKEHGAVYLNAIGGAAQFYARRIPKVHGVSWLEFGTPEAMWHLELDAFPAIVTMDAHGKSLHQEIEAASAEKLALLRA